VSVTPQLEAKRHQIVKARSVECSGSAVVLTAVRMQCRLAALSAGLLLAWIRKLDLRIRKFALVPHSHMKMDPHAVTVKGKVVVKPMWHLEVQACKVDVLTMEICLVTQMVIALQNQLRSAAGLPPPAHSVVGMWHVRCRVLTCLVWMVGGAPTIQVKAAQETLTVRYDHIC
jgi:hypothetical protein